jgi:hypothetical protein
MLAIKKARKLIEANPADAASKTLADLVLALESETPFQLADISELDYQRFEIALEILAEWRMDRYYAKKLRLVDVSTMAKNISTADAPVPSQAAPATGETKKDNE